MFPLIHQSEIERLKFCSDLWKKLEPNSADPAIKRFQSNLDEAIKLYDTEQKIIKVGDFSTRLLTESFLPGAAETVMSFALDEHKELALNMAELKLTQSFAAELEKFTVGQAGEVVTISPYQFESVLREAINKIGEPTEIKDYLTYQLAKLATDWTKSNAIQINTLAENVGLLGKEIKINQTDLAKLKNNLNMRMDQITKGLGGLEQIATYQKEALQVVKKDLSNLADYVKSELLKTESALTQEVKARIESDKQLMDQVKAIKNAWQVKKDQEDTETGLNGAKQIGYFISQLGQLSNSKTLAQVGQAISAGAQISQGITQLTGGVMPGLALLGPVGSIAMGGLALYSMFSKRKSEDASVVYLKQLSQKIEQRFDQVEKILENGFNSLAHRLEATKQIIVREIHQSQINVIKQTYLANQLTTQHISEKFNQGFSNLMNFMQLSREDINVKLYQIIMSNFDVVTSNIEFHNYDDDYFTGMDLNKFREIRFDTLKHWALRGAHKSAVTGFHLVQSIKHLDKIELQKFNQKLIKSDPTFLVGYLLNDKEIANPYIWLRAVRAYMKLAIARPDLFSNLHAIEKEVAELKISGQNIAQRIENVSSSLCNKEAYNEWFNETEFKNYFIQHLNIRFNSLIGYRMPKTNLEKLKWIAAHIVHTTKFSNGLNKVWYGKDKDFTTLHDIDLFYENVEAPPAILKSLEKNLFDDNYFIPLILFALAKLINFNIEISCDSKPAVSQYSIKLIIDTAEYKVAKFDLGVFNDHLNKIDNTFEFIKSDQNLMFNMNQSFCIWFNDHVVNVLKDLLSNENDPYLNSSSVLEADKLILIHNREMIRLFFTTSPYILKLKACFPYLKENFEELHREIIVKILLKPRVELKPIMADYYEDQLEMTTSIANSLITSGFAECSDYNEKFNALHSMTAQIIIESVKAMAVAEQNLLLPKIWDIRIDQEINDTLALLNHLSAYVTRQKELKDYSDKAFAISAATSIQNPTNPQAPTFFFIPKNKIISSLLDNAKKIPNDNNTVNIIFQNLEQAKVLQKEMHKLGIRDLEMLDYPRKIKTLEQASVVEYAIILTLTEYNMHIGENAYEKLFLEYIASASIDKIVTPSRI